MGGTGLGGLIGVLLRRDSTKIVSLLLSFAGGVMLAVVCFDLLPDSMRPENALDDIPLTLVLGGVFLGYGIIYLLNYLIDRYTNHEVEHIDEKHPKTADDLDEIIHANHWKKHRDSYLHKKDPSKYYQLFIAGVVMAFAIALHNFPEGMVIGASYSLDSSKQVIGSGLLMAIIIGLHNIPEGMAVSVPLVTGGTGRMKAVLVTALTGAPTIFGAICGHTLGMISPLWLSLSLSFASGAMLYVIFGELFPEAILMWRSKMPAFFMLIGLLLGFLLVKI